MKDKINFIIKFLILTFVLFLIWIPLGDSPSGIASGTITSPKNINCVG